MVGEQQTVANEDLQDTRVGTDPMEQSDETVESISYVFFFI